MTAKKQPIPFGKYYLLDRINIGGMAEVWRAKTFGESGFEKLVAIKRILPNIAEDEEFITMFIDEAKITVQLTHANIAQVFDLGKIGESYFIAMEYIAGRDMRAIFDRCRKKNEPAPVPMVCFMIAKMCEGLDYAHRKKDGAGSDLNIVHRDVSPQNCLISFDGEVKVIDFGIAKAANKATKTQAGILKGKFGYMSPEQVRGLPLDQRSDVFACGVTLYEMLTGERLFVGESDFSVLEKVRQVDILPPTKYNKRIPEALEKIVLKALTKDVEERYTYASDLADALQRFLITSESVFSRKDMMQYMRSTFAEDVEREKLRQAEYSEIKLPAAVAALAGAGAPRRTSALPSSAIAAAAARPPPPRPPPPVQPPPTDHTAILSAGMADGMFNDSTRPGVSGSKHGAPPSDNASPGMDGLFEDMTIPPTANVGPRVAVPVPPPVNIRPSRSNIPVAPGRPPLPTSRPGQARAAPLQERNGNGARQQEQGFDDPPARQQLKSRDSSPRAAEVSKRPRWLIPAVASVAVLGLAGVGVSAFLGGPGSVYVAYQPGDAKAYIDGAEVCEGSPCFADAVKSGPHTLEIKRDQYEKFAEQIEVQSGQRFKRAPEVKLKPLVSNVSFVLATEPADAEVKLDGKVVKPLGKRGLYKVDLTVGKDYEVRARKPGFKSWTKTITPAASDMKTGLEEYAEMDRDSFVITFNSTPPGAHVSIDNEDKGATPLTVGSLDPSRTHLVVLRKECFADATHTVMSGAESGQTIEKTLVKKPGCK